jgi:alpha-tubulin suppressor-like RCC1 family protein
VSVNNKFQQLGLPQFKQLDQFTELSFEGLLSYEEKIIKIGAGYDHSAALTNQGRIWTVGPAKVYALDERFKHFNFHYDDFSFGFLKMPY